MHDNNYSQFLCFSIICFGVAAQRPDSSMESTGKRKGPRVRGYRLLGLVYESYESLLNLFFPTLRLKFKRKSLGAATGSGSDAAAVTWCVPIQIFKYGIIDAWLQKSFFWPMKQNIGVIYIIYKVQRDTSLFISPLLALMPTSSSTGFSSRPRPSSSSDTRMPDSDGPEEVGTAVWKRRYLALQESVNTEKSSKRKSQ